MFTPEAQKVFDFYETRREKENKAQAALQGSDFFERRDEFLLSLGPEVAKVVHTLIVARGAKTILELGTSYGYSTLFLADAARLAGGRLITMEIDADKQTYARQQMKAAQLDSYIDWRCGDAPEMIKDISDPIDFVLLDIWKDLYLPCFEAFYPKLSEEALIAADNMIYPPAARPDVRKYRKRVAACEDMQTALLPIGSGVELSCKWSPSNPNL